MDRHSSYFFIWLQLELCAMAVLLTKAELSNEKILSLVHWGMYSGHGKLEFITKMQELTSSKELWFRAAVIAVPIAGGLILVLLIMLALRMLRSENKRLQDERQQMLSRLHYSFHGHQNHSGPAMPTLECCHEDMCNYRGLHDVLSPSKSEASGQGNRYQHDSSRNLITKIQEHFYLETTNSLSHLGETK